MCISRKARQKSRGSSRPCGYEPQPLSVQTADELAAAIEQAEWDLILTDWTLPTITAKAALVQLADRGVDLPMIVVSKVAGEEVIIDALKAGAHDYVLKDRLVRLVPAVKQALQKDAERKAYRVMEETLRENQGDFRKLVEGAPLGIVLLDAQLRYTKVNQAFCHMVGYREDELIGQTYKLVTHPDDLAQNMALVGDMLNHQQTGYQLQKRYVRKDGRTIWVTEHPVSGALLKSRCHVLAAFVVDMTERKETEAQLRLSKLSIDQAGEAILWFDLSAWIIDVNEAACAMLGYSKDELCRMTVHDIMVSAMPELWPALRSSLKQGETVRFEAINRTKDGRVIPVHVVTNYLEVDGREYICAFARGISAPNQAETAMRQTHGQVAQSQKLDVVERLAATIAHDFNNLLTVINGNSQLLLSDQALPDHIKHKAEQIWTAGKQAAGLTRQLLEFTKQKVLQPQILDVSKTVTEMHTFVTALMGSGIEVRLELDKSLGHIMIDPSQMEQIILHLTANARDAMPDGGTLTLETRSVSLDAEFFKEQGIAPRPGRYCLFSVCDTGTGMDSQTARRAFEPFFTTKGIGKGLGLGLSTVKDIVQDNQGLITLSTELGLGSHFRAYLPHATDTVAEEVIADLRGSETILLIEDEPLVRQFLKVVLSAQGYTILDTGSGKDAFETSAGYEGEIHLILSDVVLPDGRGPHIIEQLRPMRPGMKVLLMSGYAGVESDQDTRQIQQYPFIEKPFALPALFEAVRKILDSEGTSPIV